MYKILVVADGHEQVSNIKESTIEELKPLIKAIDEFEPYKAIGEDNIERTFSYNFATRDFVNKKHNQKTVYEIYSDFGDVLIETLMDYIPTTEYGIFEIEQITILKVEEETDLL